MRTAILAAILALSVCTLTQEKPAPPKPLEVGAAAPAFRLNDDAGQLVAVGGEAEHWTLLAFYPKAMTPG